MKLKILFSSPVIGSDIKFSSFKFLKSHLTVSVIPYCISLN